MGAASHERPSTVQRLIARLRCDSDVSEQVAHARHAAPRRHCRRLQDPLELGLAAGLDAGTRDPNDVTPWSEPMDCGKRSL